MSTVTTRLGLVKPTTLEQYALSIVNNNMDLLDTSIPRITTAPGLIDTANVGGTSSRFTRIEFGDGNGIIIAVIVCQLKTSVTLPANTASNLLIASSFVPVGYRPAATASIGNIPGVLSGAGRGDPVQFIVTIPGDLTMRNASGSTLATTANVNLIQCCCWQWNGSFVA